MKITKKTKQIFVNFVGFVTFVSEREPSAVDAYGS
jgi:hypothetical protein